MSDSNQTDQREIDFDDPKDITMDSFFRQLIEAMFDYDNDTGKLEAVINKGQSNEAKITLEVRVLAINDTKLGEE